MNASAQSDARVQRQQSSRRRLVVLLVFVALGVGLIARAVQLQGLEHEFYERQGHARQLRTVEMPAHRGTLLDRRGEALAISTPIQTIAGEPMKLAGQEAKLVVLADMLGIDAARLIDKAASGADRQREFMYIKRHVSPGLAKRAADLEIDGLVLRREYRRFYPSADATAHLVGFTDVDDTGREGLELAYDSWLRGESGQRRVMLDLNRRDVIGLDVIEPAMPGKDLQLSIDRQLQYVASRALTEAVRSNDAESASAVMIDVHTGEVLAISNYPSYNPNDTADRKGNRQRNRAITDVFEPGSTMKPFSIAAALDSGKFTPDDIVNTSPGSYTIGKYQISDMKDNGWLDLRGIVRQSSNVGMSKVARQLEPEQMWSVFDAFGFGRSPGSEFPGEVAGYFNHSSAWHRVEQSSVSYGYGISVSALHLARAYAALANDGELVPVSFLKVDEAPEGAQVIKPSVAADVQSMLEKVVSDGTGRRAQVPGYRVAGKTGTSHRSQGGGYASDRYISLFAGFAPVSDPRIALVVVVHDPKQGEYFGSVVAAPIFADIMSHALRRLEVAPDDIDDLRAEAPALWRLASGDDAQ